MLQIALIIIVVLLLISWQLNNWLHNKIVEIESKYKSLYNFHIEVCFTQKNCAGTRPKCKSCIKPTVDIFVLWRFKITGVPKYITTNGLREVNLANLQQYLVEIPYRIVTKFVDTKGKSFVKNGINYSTVGNYPYVCIIVYFDSHNANFTIEELNKGYVDGLTIKKFITLSKVKTPE